MKILESPEKSYILKSVRLITAIIKHNWEEGILMCQIVVSDKLNGLVDKDCQ